MGKRNANNPRIKPKYLVWLKDAKGSGYMPVEAKPCVTVSRHGPQLRLTG
ncbi:MAG: hypothetical protein OEN23_18905 [Paracoccaceae bacterium]|nr:hypothetical protein [Paracoccaceae bacterium]